jgi:hypothetical protein
MRAIIAALLAVFCIGAHISESCFAETTIVGYDPSGEKISDIDLLHDFIDDSMRVKSITFGEYDGYYITVSKLDSTKLLQKHGSSMSLQKQEVTELS